jgi:hypothetical protein
VGTVLQNATSRMEKNEDLQEMIQSIDSAYARRLKMAWDIFLYNFVSSKVC